MTAHEQAIRDYIDGYNEYDIRKMVKDMTEDVIFENIVDGEMTMRMTGRQAFLMQAEQALHYFQTRKQTIKDFRHSPTKTEVDIDYQAVVAEDIPNGPARGEELTMTGKSVFAFEDGKITRLTDIS